MAARLLLKRVLPGAVVYYGGVQGYLAYHLLWGCEGKVRKPDLPEIEPQESRKKLVENILSMYEVTARTKNFDTFVDDVEIEDHSAYIKGKKNLMNAIFMCDSIKAKGETLSLTQHHYQDQFIMEMRQNYTFLGCQMEIPSVVYVQLAGEGDDQKVKVWHDEWYGKELITPENTRFLFTGTASRFFRRMHGKICNVFKYDEPKSTQELKTLR